MLINVMKKGLFFIVVIVSLFVFGGCQSVSRVDVFGTNDIHGAYFGKDYVTGEAKVSLSNVHFLVESFRDLVGEENILLLDCGDNIQGDNASYYFNYVDSSGNPHLMSRIFNFMKYDAVVVGNHDLEAGHSVYDGITSDYEGDMLAANAFHSISSQCYFKPFSLFNKGGLDIAVVGFTNPNVKSWIAPEKYSGIEFSSITDLAQNVVDKVRREEDPDIVILALHSGLGEPENDDFENCALYIASNIRGVDVVMAAHDHRSLVRKFFNGEDSVLVVDGGARLSALSHISIEVTKKWGKVVNKKISGELVPIYEFPQSESYNEAFAQDFKKVKEFSNMSIGRLVSDLDMEYKMEGDSPYMKLIHKLQLSQNGVDVSINAPLASSGVIPAGELKYNDLFTLYRFENLLYIIQMSGGELDRYLEVAYQKRLSGDSPLYNLDSAAGIVYTVSRSASEGERVNIISMADGTPFETDKIYNVAMTSYRASGAGGMLQEAGIDPTSISERIVEVLPEIRDLLYQYVVTQRNINPQSIFVDKNIGNWSIVR